MSCGPCILVVAGPDSRNRRFGGRKILLMMRLLAPGKLVHPPRTIKAVLLAGFLVILAVWLGSSLYFTRRLTETLERSAAIHARYARGQELLSTIRSQVFLASIYVRDALIETSQALEDATPVREQLRGLQDQVNQEIEQYKAIESLDEGATWTRLEDELREYWDAAVRVVMPASVRRALPCARSAIATAGSALQ